MHTIKQNIRSKHRTWTRSCSPLNKIILTHYTKFLALQWHLLIYILFCIVRNHYLILVKDLRSAVSYLWPLLCCSPEEWSSCISQSPRSQDYLPLHTEDRSKLLTLKLTELFQLLPSDRNLICKTSQHSKSIVLVQTYRNGWGKFSSKQINQSPPANDLCRYLKLKVWFEWYQACIHSALEDQVPRLHIKHRVAHSKALTQRVTTNKGYWPSYSRQPPQSFQHPANKEASPEHSSSLSVSGDGKLSVVSVATVSQSAEESASKHSRRKSETPVGRVIPVPGGRGKKGSFKWTASLYTHTSFFLSF